MIIKRQTLGAFDITTLTTEIINSITLTKNGTRGYF